MSKPTIATVERQATRLIRQIDRTEQKLVDMNRRIKEQHEREERQRTRAAVASAMWASSPAAGVHPWLEAQGIVAHGLRQRDNRLLMPMRDAAGELWNLQLIGPAGGKRTLYGARVFGLFHLIDVPGHPDTWVSLGSPAVLNIAEDYASAARVHAATGQPVAVAFELHNLRQVALTLREHHPASHIAVWLPETPQGARSASSAYSHAAGAAAAVGGSVAALRGRP